MASPIALAFLEFRNRLSCHFAGGLVVASSVLTYVPSILLVIASVFLGATVNPAYYAGILGFIPLQWMLAVHRRKRAARKLQSQIKEQWLSLNDPEEDFEWLENEHVNYSCESERDNKVGNQTWDDLEMDRVFSRIDRTWTSLGETSLYAYLRAPVLNPTHLHDRMKLVNMFQSDESLREPVQRALALLGKARRFRLADLEDDRHASSTFLRKACRCLAWVSGLSLATSVLLHAKPLIVAVIVLFALNLIVASWFRWLVYWQANAFLYLNAAISCAARMGAIEHDSFREYARELTYLSAQTRAIYRKARVFDRERSTSLELPALMLEYARALFLLDVSDYFRLADLVRTHQMAIRRLLRLVGQLDACLSIASYRMRLPVYSEPSLLDNARLLEFEGCRHPLLPDAVPNSLTLDANSMFLTGSNTSGKSTFLRAVALNALLAQTVGTVCADSYRASCFRIFSSIAIFDDLSEAKSLFRAEAERMLEIVQAAEGACPILCVIDEPFKGTNSPERIGATIATLRYLAPKNALVLVASHHVPLALKLGTDFEVFHFPAPADDTHSSNYVLRKGLDYNLNALDVLDKLGYPTALVEAARTETARVLQKPGESL